MTALSRIMNHELRIMVLVLSMILASLFLIQPVYAQTPTPKSTWEESPSTALGTSKPTPEVFQTLPATVNPTSPLYTDLLVNNLFHSFSCIAIGQSVIGQPCLTYQMTRNAQGALQGIPVLSQTNLSGGALGATTSLIGMLYTNPPVRTVDYLASVSGGFGIARVAHAQVGGSGAAVLNPILKLWQVSRNISYLVMIIIFLVIGLMIMFRNKINPQTVITAQAALPGLVIGLILITFSYFLAGLISDMAFVGTNVVGYYFQAAQGNQTQNLVEDTKNQNVLSIFSPLTSILHQSNISQALDSIWPSLERKNRQEWNPLDFDPSRVITALAGMMAMQFVMPFANMFGPIGSIVGGVVTFGSVAAKPTAIAGFALAFIAIIILIFAMLKLLYRLINTYLTIIFLTFTAPFQFLVAALPGRQGIATGWILNMLANVLVFPVVIAVLYFVAFLIGPEYIKEYYPDCKQPSQPCVFRISQLNQTEQNTSTSSVYAADENTSRLVSTSAFPLFGGMDLDLIRLILAFGALVALPSIPDILGRTIGRMGQTGQLIGQEIGSGIGQGRQYAGQLSSGLGGFTGQVGRITDEPHYWKDNAGNYIINPQLSRAGVIGKIRGTWNSGAQPNRPRSWYRRWF